MDRKTFSVKDQGGYIQVYSRGRNPSLDLNFFDGERSLQETIDLRDALNEAIEFAERMAAAK